MPAVSRPAWMAVLSGVADRGIGPRKSPVEIVATMGSYVTRTQAAQVSGLRPGRSAGGPISTPCARTAWRSPATGRRTTTRSWPSLGRCRLLAAQRLTARRATAMDRAFVSALTRDVLGAQLALLPAQATCD